MKRAFTLIELLVVVGIIGILASLIAPTLERSRASVGGAVCRNNLRQLGTASQLYWNDNSQNPFPFKGSFTNNGDIFWFGWLGRGAEGKRIFDLKQGFLAPYVGTSIRLCPQFDYAMAEFKLKATGAAYGYGYNLHLSPAPTTTPVKIADLLRPSDLALFADAAQVNDFQAPASPEHPLLEEFYYINATEQTAHFRHAGSSLVTFCDGHVSASKPEPGSIDARLPKSQVGRLSPQFVLP